MQVPDDVMVSDGGWSRMGAAMRLSRDGDSGKASRPRDSRERRRGTEHKVNCLKWKVGPLNCYGLARTGGCAR